MDTTCFTFAKQFQMRDTHGMLRDYAETIVIKGETSLPKARAEHTNALRGGWVRPGYSNPEVSELRVMKGGRLLPEHLAGKRTLEDRPFEDVRYGTDAA